MKKLLSLIVPPIAKFIALFHKPDDITTSSDYEQLRSIIRNGDILVSRTDWELSNLIMPGYWKHCAVYKDGYVYEAVTKQGVRKILVEEFFFKKDHIGLCRNSDYLPSEDDLSHGFKFLDSELGESYNWSFELDVNNKNCCSQLAYNFLLKVYR